MTDRVNRYYQLPASKALVNHFKEDIGLTDKYIDIFVDLRYASGDTITHADNVGLPIKQYNAMSAILGQACMRELVRLAEIGLDAELNPSEY